MGFAMAQQLVQQGGLGGGGGQPPPMPGSAPAPAPAPAPAAGAVDIMTPAQVAQVLGVTEQDVVASIDAGDLKGKKIGSQYRVTKAALDEFLRH